jgi:hypothetical protein
MDQISGERRGAARYDLQLQLRYRVIEGNRSIWRGTGLTADISRTGIRFVAPRPVPVNARMELTIDWPVRFGGMYPMELSINGSVLRCEGTEVVVKVASWQFRVAASARLDAPDAEHAQGWAPRSRTREGRVIAAHMLM